ncbi:MAG TPA: deoxyribose-phosphate aldolase [Solirubrobacteraceae bacterium]|jgi:deoxyribose-phosphate aldolase|nr:deoxyribose-phosphate aldolase [Solirubrobacteraceae bacterium]
MPEPVAAWAIPDAHRAYKYLAGRSVDSVGLEQRAAMLGTRSVKTVAKDHALRTAIGVLDLTTLEGSDTAGKVRRVSVRAVRPDPADPSIPSVAAVCVYPNLVAEVAAALRGTSVKVASVATGFPAGQVPLAVKLREVEYAVAAGADEIDMVLDRGALLAGRYPAVVEEVRRVKAACDGRHLKVILETGELGGYEMIRRASLLAIAGGADFIKTSTGKLPRAATPPVVLCMLEAVRDVYQETGRMIGVKAAGGVRLSKQAITLLVLVHETLGPAWLTPDLFRIGASSLLNDLLMQVHRRDSGVYQSPDGFPID